MLDHEHFMKQAVHDLAYEFKDRLMFVGLQGSYLRGDATEDSDLDILIVLDTLNAEDILTIRNLLRQQEGGDLAHGFTAGQEELLHWPAHEIFQFLQDTRAYYRELAPLLPAYERGDIVRGAATSASGLYHMAVHTLLADEDMEQEATIHYLYKSFFHTIQLVHYLRTDDYLTTRQALAAGLEGDEKAILLMSMEPEVIDEAAKRNLDFLYDRLIGVLSQILQELG